MDWSMPGFPVLHYFLVFVQTHVRWIGDAIQPAHLLLPPSSDLNLSQHQSQFFASGGQSIGVSASASVFPMNIQGLFPLGLAGFTSLLFKRLSRIFSSTIIWKYQFFGTQPSLWSNFHFLYLTAGKPLALTRQTFVGKVTSLLFNMLFRFIIDFLPGSKHLLISWPHSSVQSLGTDSQE